MALTAEESETLATYEKEAAAFDEDRPHWKDTEFYAVVQNIPQRGRVLEMGCGTGAWIPLFASEGIRITGVDISGGMLAVARRQFPQAPLVQGDMSDLSFFRDGSFDGFWSVASLMHVSKDKAPRLFRELRRVLKPSAIGFIATPEGDFTGMYEGTFNTCWRPDELLAALREAGFKPFCTKVDFNMLQVLVSCD